MGRAAAVPTSSSAPSAPPPGQSSTATLLSSNLQSIALTNREQREVVANGRHRRRAGQAGSRTAHPGRALSRPSPGSACDAARDGVAGGRDHQPMRYPLRSTTLPAHPTAVGDSMQTLTPQSRAAILENPDALECTLYRPDEYDEEAEEQDLETHASSSPAPSVRRPNGMPRIATTTSTAPRRKPSSSPASPVRRHPIPGSISPPCPATMPRSPKARARSRCSMSGTA